METVAAILVGWATLALVGSYSILLWNVAKERFWGLLLLLLAVPPIFGVMILQKLSEGG